MGFLRKVGRKIKKGIKKVFKGIKKVVNKVSKSKLFKTIALVGAALVTGGASVGAFGGTLAKSKIGQALIGAKNFITSLPVVGTVAKPFEFLGTTLGTGAGKVTDFLGFTSEASRLLDPTKAVEILERAGVSKDIIGQMTAQQNLDLAKAYLDVQGGTGALQAQTLAKATGQTLPEGVAATFSPLSVTEAVQTSTGFFDTGVGQVVRDAGLSYVESQLQPEPEISGTYVGYGGDEQSMLDPLQVSFAQPAVNIGDAYSTLQFGTADPGYLATDLYRQETVGGIV